MVMTRLDADSTGQIWFKKNNFSEQRMELRGDGSG